MYGNARGVTKKLPCSLAYDVGYVHEALWPGATEMPGLSHEKQSRLRNSCLSKIDTTPRINGFIMGVLDRRNDAKG